MRDNVKPTFEGIITEFMCRSCGFKGKPGSFSEDRGSFRCPICNKVVVTMDDIVQEALRMDDKNREKESER